MFAIILRPHLDLTAGDDARGAAPPAGRWGYYTQGGRITLMGCEVRRGPGPRDQLAGESVDVVF